MASGHHRVDQLAATVDHAALCGGRCCGWLLSKPVITAPIVGATKLHQLDDAIASVNIKLSAGEIAALEEPYVPHAVVGFE
jgi:aryl-alcohol dehydrogenase-like predicted oxidoreductase